MSAPGWYPDPAGGPEPRYWDGQNWAPAAQPVAGPQHSAPHRSHRARWTIIGAVAVVVVGLGVSLPLTLTGSSGNTPQLHVKGGLVLSDGVVKDEGGTVCYGTNGYGDIAKGAEVVISDSTGKTIAVSELGSGKPVDPDSCAFFFTADVPQEQFYGVEVTHRGVVKYTLAQMRKGPVLSLGDD